MFRSSNERNNFFSFCSLTLQTTFHCWFTAFIWQAYSRDSSCFSCHSLSVVIVFVDFADPGPSCCGGPERQPRWRSSQPRLQTEGALWEGHFPSQQRCRDMAAVRKALWRRTQRQPRGQWQGQRLTNVGSSFLAQTCCCFPRRQQQWRTRTSCCVWGRSVTKIN